MADLDDDGVEEALPIDGPHGSLTVRLGERVRRVQLAAAVSRGRRDSRHFGPEGFGSPMMFLIMFTLLFLPLPLIPLGISPALAWGAVLVAIPVWLWPLKQWPLKDKTIPVRVEDVVTAAKTKRWPIAYDEES